MQPLSQVSEREERESSTSEYEPFKVPREALPTRAWSIYNPPSRYKPLCEKCVPCGLSAMPSRIVRVWIPTVKTRSQRLSKVPVGRADSPPGPREQFAWATRIVHGYAADRSPGPPELHTVLSGFEVNNGPSASNPRTVRLEANFLENQTLYIK
jgi:hypothetical protein